MKFDPASVPVEELLAALVAGDVAVDDAQVAARFAAEPRLEERWQQLAGTLDELRSAMGREDRSLPADAVVPRVDVGAAIASCRGQQVRPPVASRRLFLLAGVGLAASAALLLLLKRAPTAPAIDPHLGGRTDGLSPDRQQWAEGAPLQWGAVRGAESYRIELQSATGGASIWIPSATTGFAPLTTTQWLPTSELRATLPLRFRWRVAAVDGSGSGFATSAWAETWR